MIMSASAYADAPSSYMLPPSHGQAEPEAPTVERPRPKNDRERSRDNYCSDNVLRVAAVSLYSVNGSPFENHPKYEQFQDPRDRSAHMAKDREEFIGKQFLEAMLAGQGGTRTNPVTAYHHKRPRYFEVQWKVPGFDKKFETVRYTLDSPLGYFSGDKRDVIKVEPIDPQTKQPFEPRLTNEFCRYNAYRCVGGGGCKSGGVSALSDRVVQVYQARARVMLDHSQNKGDETPPPPMFVPPPLPTKDKTRKAP